MKNLHSYNFFFRPGDAFKEMLKIKNKEVKGYPDVRFISCSSEGDCSSLEGDCSSSEGDCKTVAVTEVLWTNNNENILFISWRELHVLSNP